MQHVQGSTELCRSSGRRGEGRRSKGSLRAALVPETRWREGSKDWGQRYRPADGLRPSGPGRVTVAVVTA